MLAMPTPEADTRGLPVQVIHRQNKLPNKQRHNRISCSCLTARAPPDNYPSIPITVNSHHNITRHAPGKLSTWSNHLPSGLSRLFPTRIQFAISFGVRNHTKAQPLPPPNHRLPIAHVLNTTLTLLLCSGILHTIFFHRYFPAIIPQTRDVLGMDLPYISEAEIETLIDQRVAALARQLEMERNQPHHVNHHSTGASGSGRGQVTVQFFEKQRRKAWFPMRGDDEVCWENWTVKVTVAEPRTEAGTASSSFYPIPRSILLTIANVQSAPRSAAQPKRRYEIRSSRSSHS